MAGYARYTALLDACVLVPLVITDSLMSLATAGLFAAKRTQQIEQEWISALEKQRPDLKGRLETRRDYMREAIPDWEIAKTAWAPLVGHCMRARWKRPEATPEDFAQALERGGLLTTAQRIREAADLI